MNLPSINLNAVRLAFRFVVQSDMDLGEFPGNTIRSGLGAKLRALVCVTKQAACQGCALAQQCAYPQLFEAGFSGNGVSGFENAPKPYVIHLREGMKRRWRPGEELVFELVLLGPAVAYAPHLVYALDEVGKTGLGTGWKTGKGRYDLVEVATIDQRGAQVLLTAPDKKLTALPEARPVADLLEHVDAHPDSCRLHFVTPLRLRKRGRWIGTRDLEANHLVESIRRRVEVLAMIYGDAVQLGPAQSFQDIRVGTRKLRRQSQERYSSRTKSSMPMDGLLGEIELKGAWQRLYPLLQLGELLHIGKGATMGMGQYELMA